MQKLFKVLCVVSCVFLMIPMVSMKAKEMKPVLNVENNKNEVTVVQYIDEMFSSFDSSKKILQLPDGGYLQGEMISSINDDLSELGYNKVTIFNSETDANAITVNSAKETLIKDFNTSKTRDSIIVPFGAKVPTEIRELAARGTYISSSFSGSGWRFGGYIFKAGPNTGGTFLKWTSFKDTAMVGTPDEARLTLSGTDAGRMLQIGTPQSEDSKNGTVYYTKNPVNGSYYIVANIE